MNRKKRIIRIASWAFLFALALVMTVWAEPGDNADAVITGKDGWYFYDAENSVNDYMGADLFTDEQLSDIRGRLLKIKDYCDERGIQFIIFLAPNKEHIYSEYMPDEYGSPASYTRIEQLMDYLGGEFCVVTPLWSLFAAKESMPEFLYYYKTDSHWNELGAYIGAKDILEAAGLNLPDLSTLSIGAASVHGKDLAREIGMEMSTEDTEYMPEGYGPYTTVQEYSDEEQNYFHFYTEGAPARNMTIYGDSFSIVPATYLGQEFENVYLHRAAAISESVLEEEQPSVLVYERVERSFDFFPLIDLIE